MEVIFIRLINESCWIYSDDSSDSNDEDKPSNEKLADMLVCGPGVMCPTNDDKEAVAVRHKKKKSKNNERSSVNFEPEKYEAALRSILGML